MYQSLGLRPPVRPDLESLIRSCIQGQAAHFSPETNIQEIEAYSRRKVEEIHTLLRESPPTPFEDLSAYVNILALAHELEESARNSADGLVLTRPIFGTVPLGGVNAFTQQEDGEYIVAFSTGLFSFAELMGRSLARTVQYTGINQGVLPSAPEQLFHGFSFNTDDIRESLRRNPQGAKCFTEAVLAYVRRGRPDASNMPELDPARDAFASMVYHFFLEFVIAHEYGHIFHNHLDQKAQGVPEDASAVRTIMWDWRKEAEADVAGCGLMLVGARTRPINLAALLMGIEVFLSCYETLDRALSVLTVGDEEYAVTTSRHPPARARRTFLHHHLLSRANEFLDGQNAEARMRSALQEGVRLSEVINVLWEQARPYLWRLYELGSKPAPIFKRTSDSQSSADSAMLGEARAQLKQLLPDVVGTLERAEILAVSGKELMRVSAAALFKDESGMDQTEIDEALTAIDLAVKRVGQNFVVAAQVLSELRPVLASTVVLALPVQYQAAADKTALAGERLNSAGLSKAKAALLHEGARSIHEAGGAFSAMGETSGVGLHLMQTGEFLGLGSEALLQDKLPACWRATKLAGVMVVLSGECLIRGAVELWRVRLLPIMGAALLSLALPLQQDRVPPLWILRDVLSLYKEAKYALLGSLRRSASFFRNVELPVPDAETKFRQAAGVLKAQADILYSVAARIADAESALDRTIQETNVQSSMVEVARVLDAAADALGQAVIKEQELGLQTVLKHLATVLSLAGSHLANHNPTAAAQLMESLGWRVLQTASG
jgi:hypothetical protein